MTTPSLANLSGITADDYTRRIVSKSVFNLAKLLTDSCLNLLVHTELTFGFQRQTAVKTEGSLVLRSNALVFLWNYIQPRIKMSHIATVWLTWILNIYWTTMEVRAEQLLLLLFVNIIHNIVRATKDILKSCSPDIREHGLFGTDPTKITSSLLYSLEQKMKYICLNNHNTICFLHIVYL